MLCRLLERLANYCIVCWNNFWFRIILLLAGTLGLEAAYAVEMNYAIPVLLKAGLQERYASIVWAFSPILGIFFQGYLGAASDSCRCWWGRRRPFILGLAICVFVSLFIFPYGNTIANSLFLTNEPGSESNTGLFIFTYSLLVFGIMDFSLDQFDAPLRMYLLDSVSVEQSGRANFIYTFISSLGSCCGALIGAVNWSQSSRIETETENFDYQVRFVFGTVAIFFALCVIISLNSFSEPLKSGVLSLPSSPSIVKRFVLEPTALLRIDTGGAFTASDTDNLIDSKTVECKLNFQTEIKEVIDKSHPISTPSHDQSEINVSIMEQNILHNQNLHKDKSSALPHKQNKQGFLQSISINLHGTFEFVCHISPYTLILWIMSLLDWIAIMSLTLFLSDFVGIVVYGGSPDASLSEEASSLYDSGVRMTSKCKAVVFVFDLIYVIALEHFSERINSRLLLVVGHVLHVVALTLLLVMPCIATVLLVLLSIGILDCHLLSIPYTLIHNYEEHNILLKQAWPHRSDTKGKAVSLFSTAFFVAQLLLALFMGTLIDLWGSPVVIVIISLVATVLGGCVASRVTNR